MTGRYARNTQVPVARSKQEAEAILRRYGADEIIMGESAARSTGFVQFLYCGLPVRIAVPLPDSSDAKFWWTPAGKRKREPNEARREWEKACRQQWRFLCLLLKAQLEAIENGLVKAEEVFLPWFVLASGRTVTEEAAPALRKAMEQGGIEGAAVSSRRGEVMSGPIYEPKGRA